MGQDTYPILRESSDNFVNSIFQFEEDKTDCFHDKNQVVFNFSLLLTNSSFLEYLEKGFVKLVARVECGRTAYRQTFNIEKLYGRVTIPDKFVDSDVSISIFIIATEDFDYSPEDLVEDFSNFTMPVSIGTILGQTTPKVYTIEKNNFVSTDSFFQMSFVDGEGVAPMVDYGDNNYININFPRSMKQLYSDSENQEMLKATLLNTILMEVLIKQESDSGFLEGTNWGKRLLENINFLLNESESLAECNKYELIGELLPNHNIVRILESSKEEK